MDILALLRSKISVYGSGRPQYWLEHEEMAAARSEPKVQTLNLNISQNDGTYKTVIVFEGCNYVHVGDQLKTDPHIHLDEPLLLQNC